MTHYRTDKGDRNLIPWDEIIVDVREDPDDDQFELVETRPATVEDVKNAALLKAAMEKMKGKPE